ncbi:hypothetical protein BDN72DRAFT_860983 [Pluteus cervinus]|uniref:Uncharacterized protein n=1 Tax=Pluteus cervinus TaxID=181527 RepID=A0ACD3AH24_9AGAR|nr:hypothetical protein BDN72DRAFT_860983 [Pluteus cervinus]
MIRGDLGRDGFVIRRGCGKLVPNRRAEGGTERIDQPTGDDLRKVGSPPIVAVARAHSVTIGRVRRYQRRQKLLLEYRTLPEILTEEKDRSWLVPGESLGLRIGISLPSRGVPVILSSRAMIANNQVMLRLSSRRMHSTFLFVIPFARVWIETIARTGYSFNMYYDDPVEDCNQRFSYAFSSMVDICTTKRESEINSFPKSSALQRTKTKARQVCWSQGSADGPRVLQFSVIGFDTAQDRQM